MADIARYPFVRHLRGNATSHVAHVRNGKTVHAGVGAAFWFRPLSAVLTEVPVDDRELPLLLPRPHRRLPGRDRAGHGHLPASTDPTVAAGRIDFSIDPEHGRWRGTPLDQVAGLLTESAQQHAVDLLAGGRR